MCFQYNIHPCVFNIIYTHVFSRPVKKKKKKVTKTKKKKIQLTDEEPVAKKKETKKNGR